MWQPERPQWIIVVQADRAALYADLRASFRGMPWVAVLLERRQGERRGRTVRSRVERRLADRRSVQDDPTRTPSHRISDHAEGFAVYQATGLAGAHCEECSATVRFEMPRFAEPPGRLEVDVSHDVLLRKQARHFVELRASTPSGRVLLASRLLGRTVVGPVP